MGPPKPGLGQPGISCKGTGWRAPRKPPVAPICGACGLLLCPSPLSLPSWSSLSRCFFSEASRGNKGAGIRRRRRRRRKESVVRRKVLPGNSLPLSFSGTSREFVTFLFLYLLEMPAVLEVFPVPRPTAGHRATVSGAALSPVSRSSSPRTISLRATRGLRLVYRPVRVCSAVSFGSWRRSGTFVCELRDTATQVPPINETTWQSLVIKEEGPVLVEFWAPWCGPCRMIDPVVSELAVQYSGKLKFYKLNTDESPNIATRYGIRSIPTVMIFRRGEKKETIIGAVPKTTLTTSIEKLLP